MSQAAVREPPRQRSACRLTRVDAAVVALALTVSGGVSVWLGQDLNFDLLSYHYYNGYALVEGRLDQDIAPAEWHTYINPVMDAFYYVAMVGLPPRAFGFLMGAVHGLNVVLLYLVTLAVLAPLEPRRARGAALLTALVGGVGPSAVSLLGTTMGNNLLSIPVLGSLLLLLWPTPEGRSPLEALPWSSRRLLWAAALCGVSSGLRLTAVADHLALLAVLIGFSAWKCPRRVALRTTAWLAAGSALGFLSVSGVWSAKLLARFGNPLFPFANQVFRSPFFDTEFLRDRRWVARGAWDYLSPPLDIALGRMDRLQEIGGRDARFLVLFVALLAVVVVAAARRARSGAGIGMTAAERFVVLYWLVAYGLWAATFYYYRYMITLELLAPLVLVVLVRAVASQKAFVPILLAASLGLCAWVRPGSWGRGDWQENWFGLELPALARQPGAMVLLLGGPITFAIPDFPADARFTHLTAIRERGGTVLFDQMIARALEAHRGPLLLLSSFRVDKDAQDPRRRRPRWAYNPEEDAGPKVASFGLELTDRCADTRTRRLRLYVCEVDRRPVIRTVEPGLGGGPQGAP